MTSFVTRISEYAIYYDESENQIYVEKENSDFAAVFAVPSSLSGASNPVEKIRDAINHQDQLHVTTKFKLEKTDGVIEDERVPPGKVVDKRPRGQAGQPAGPPPGEPGPPPWAGKSDDPGKGSSNGQGPTFEPVDDES